MNSVINEKKLLCILIRGHERNTFATPAFSFFIKQLTSSYDAHIYIHTWTEAESKLSWRPVNRSMVKPITKNMVFDYFKDVTKCIKNVTIDDDTKINLIGNTAGKIGGIPIIAWKNMWYGKFSTIEKIKRAFDDGTKYNLVLNIRMDNFSCVQSINNGLNQYAIKQKIDSLMKLPTIDNNIYFFKNEPFHGCDNVYLGSVNAMYDLIKHFHYDMDNIRTVYDIQHQEFIVMYEADKLFPINNVASKYCGSYCSQRKIVWIKIYKDQKPQFKPPYYTSTSTMIYPIIDDNSNIGFEDIKGIDYSGNDITSYKCESIEEAHDLFTKFLRTAN